MAWFWKDNADVLDAIAVFKGAVMARFDELMAQLGALNAQTTRMGTVQSEQLIALANVAADITRIKDQIVAFGGLSAAQADGVIAALGASVTTITAATDQMQATADALKAVAAEFPEPEA
jgi:hypothetical protein